MTKQDLYKNRLTLSFIVISVFVFGFLAGRGSMPIQQDSSSVLAVVQSKVKMYESAVNRCLQLAKNSYLRDFITLCKATESYPSGCADTNLDTALGYGLYQLGADPSGRFAVLYSTWESDNDLCIDSAEPAN